MAEARSAGVETREIDLTGPTSIEPVGIPAGVIAPASKGQAFVPATLPTMADFIVKFGPPTTSYRYGPLAASEWFRNAQALTYLRVLGIGDGKQRVSSGNNKGKVNYAGFIVGDQQPQTTLTGALGDNPYANAGGPPGRTFFLGAFMSQSVNSTVFTDAGLSAQGNPVIRGVLMAASGVFLTLSTSVNTTSSAPSSTVTASLTNFMGALTGTVNLSSSKQEFVMLLNGHKGTDPVYPNVITASFDPSAPNYFGKILNSDPYRMEQAGYMLYASYDLHPAIATVTGSGIVTASLGAGATGQNGLERSAFLLTGSQTRNSGSATAPNFENFENRFTTAKSPWVTSQKFGGTYHNLFQIWAVGDGQEPNVKLKFSLENIQPSNTTATNFGTFDLLVRDFTDNDNKKIVLETWRGLSLDTDSPRFIGNIIGDTRTFFNFDASEGKQRLTTEGNYSTRSRYIRVKIADDVLNGEMPDTALPMGFRGMPHLMTSGSAPMGSFSDSTNLTVTNPWYKLVQPPVPFRLSLTKGASPTQTTDKALYWGVQFENIESPTEPNSTFVANPSIASFVKYFPNFHTEWQNVIAFDNHGTADTAANGIIDADRFNNNVFSLENIKVVYNATSLIADVTNLDSWIYVRNGSISTDISALTRALKVSDLEDPSVRAVCKFTLPIQGGFDGTRIFNQDTFEMTNKAITEELNYTNRGSSSGPTVSAYMKALTLMNDVTEVDIQLLTLPGIRNNFVTDTALSTTENRFDALLIFDVEERDVDNSVVIDSTTQRTSVNFTANQFASRGVNSSFGAAYFPDVAIRDEFNRAVVRVPPSVAVLGAFAKNDAIGYPWNAPAGFARASLERVNDPSVRLSKANMNILQSVNINPIVSFAGTNNSVVVWGQKTVYSTPSPLDRVNVRRLLISIRRQVRQISNRILWESTKEATLQRFSQLVNPVLKDIQDKKGLDNFKVMIDTSTTTQADFENRTIKGKIFVVPTKTIEQLSIDFVLGNRTTFVQG